MRYSADTYSPCLHHRYAHAGVHLLPEAVPAKRDLPPGYPYDQINSESTTAGFQFQQTTLHSLSYLLLATFDAEDFGDLLEYWPALKVTVIVFTNFANNGWLHSVSMLPLLFK